MGYFQSLVDEAAKLDKLADAYLAKLPFLSMQDTADRLWNAAWKIFEDANSDLNAVPDYVASICGDGFMPYYNIPRKGSLKFALGFSIVSQEAHLRNLLEIAEGRETEFLSFDIVADVP